MKRGPDSIRLGIIAGEHTGLTAWPGNPNTYLDHFPLYLNVLPRCRGIAQLAIADQTGQSAEVAQRRWGQAANLRVFRDHREMIEVFRPDMVLVVLESDLAPRAIELALEANCHVLAEKPACTRLEDFERLVL